MDLLSRRSWRGGGVFGAAFAALVGLALVAWSVAHIGNFIEDDTLISLRYAQRLLEGEGLTWTDGERVEGYSNLSWVLGSAALGAVGVDLITAARTLAVVSLLVTFIALAGFVRRVADGWGVVIAAVLLGSTVPVAVWILGALEQPLVIACLAVTLWALAELGERDFSTRPWAWVAGAALAVLVLTRPDAPLFVALLGCVLPLVHGRTRWREQLRAAAVVVGMPFVTWLAQLVFRLGYYGEWLPNTAFVKATVSAARAQAGLTYVSEGLRGSWLLSLAAGVGFGLSMFDQRARRWALALLLIGASWVAYVIAIGGDHFPSWRHLLPVDLLLCALPALGMVAVHRRWPAFWLVSPLSVLAVAVTVPSYVHAQWALGRVDVARRARWQWEGQAVGELFGEAFKKEQPLYAVTAAGCLPFFSKLPALDMLGLNDKHIARQPGWAQLPLGHEHGDGKYVLERAPDLVTFGWPRGDRPHFKSGDEMAADPSFKRDYVRVRFQSYEPLSLYSDTFARIRGRIGIREDGHGGLLVPTWLFSNVIGVPSPDGGMGALLRENSRATLDVINVAPGTWQARLDPPNPRVAVRLMPLAEVEGAEVQLPPSVLSLPRTTTVRVELATSELSTVVGTVRLEPASTAHTAADAPLAPSAAPATADLSLEGGGWTLTGDAFAQGSATTGRNGQRAVEDAPTRFLNSFRDSTPERSGDDYEGLATSAVFVPTPRSWLEFRVGGGRSEAYESQTGVRLVERLSTGERKVRFVASGQGDEKLRPVNLDLGWLAGRTLHIEVFDQARGAWGHVLAGGFVLHEGEPAAPGPSGSSASEAAPP